ncbi:MAG TPA: TonB-dependent receptor, partial [Gemmatimonadaceae bacterium]
MPRCSTLAGRLLRRPALVAALLVLLPQLAPAQVGAGGAIRGRVTSPEHTPVAGAAVVVTGAAGGVERRAVADADGRFAVTGLEAGRYVARVRAPGYRPAERRDLRLAAGGTLALDVALERAPAVMDAVVTTATRSASALTEVPGAVTVVTREQVAEQARLTPRLGPMLAQLVPGLGAGTESMSNYGQSLRGRDVLVLIDGVPQSTSRSVSRDFVTLDPAMVERVEVVRGASAMYGDGATGGVVNIITRRGTGGPLRFTSEVGVESAVSAPGDGLGTRLSQTVAGGRGAWDVMAGASLTRTGGLFDAQGDRIPPDPTGQGGVAESDGYDLIAKLGWSHGAQRLQLGGNYYRSE